MKGQRRSDCAIDLGLAVITAISPPGWQWNFQDQAYACGCSRERMRQIYSRALRKMRIRLEQQGITIEQVREVLKVWNKL